MHRHAFVKNLRVVQLVLLAQLWFSLPSVVRGSAFMLVIAGSSFLNRMGIKKDARLDKSQNR